MPIVPPNTTITKVEKMENGKAADAAGLIPPTKIMKDRRDDASDLSGTHVQSAANSSSSSESDNNEESDSFMRRKKRITEDGMWEYLGDDKGFVRLAPAKQPKTYTKRSNFRKKWTTAMKRHWNTIKKTKAMAAITIRRCDLSTVTSHHLRSISRHVHSNLITYIRTPYRFTRD